MSIIYTTFITLTEGVTGLTEIVVFLINNIFCARVREGGIGKSLIATPSVSLISKLGYQVGILDLNFSGPCVHKILSTKEEI
jgi:Mrp family chromosome partitioning ATPase